MASAENDGPDTPARPRRFTASSIPGPAPEVPADGGYPKTIDALLPRRVAIGGVSMGVTAVVCFVLAAGFAGGEHSPSGEITQRVSELRDQIRLAQAQAEALPAAKDAARGLVAAQNAAEQIARLQNDYRALTPGVAAAGGKLDPAAASPTHRNLAPYFAPSVPRSALDPWYLLAGDKDIPHGTEATASVGSGVTWVALRPDTIADDGTIRVTWLAIGARAEPGQTAAVFAWARAHFDLTRTAFSALETGTTATGEALRLAVTTS